MKRGPLKVFFSYAHEDEALRDRIDEHLELLRRQNLILTWHDRKIVPGTKWDEVISEKLASSDIILLLVSQAFMASEYVHQHEIPEAMEAQEISGVHVVAILLEKDTGWTGAPFKELQILPSEANPIAAWKDTVDAFRDVAHGIRTVARDIIIGEGPFEFGPHEFTEAELAVLPKVERQRTAAGLQRLRDDLTMPARSYESNLIVATWALRKFGSDRVGNELEALFYMAQVITSFDLVALQEVDRNLDRLNALMEILGPDWSVLVTDAAPGIRGNRERFAFLYYRPRVEFRNFSSQVILPPEQSPGGKPAPVQQFARPPWIASFRSGGTEFQACIAHIAYAGRSTNGEKERLVEVDKLCAYLQARSEYEKTDLLLLGTFQMGHRDSPILDVLRKTKVQIPDELLHSTYYKRSGDKKSGYYDLIGFLSSNRSIPLDPSNPRSGAYNLFRQVLRDEDLDTYKKTDSFRNILTRPRSDTRSSVVKSKTARQYDDWKTYLVSDHLPLWAELRVEESPAS